MSQKEQKVPQTSGSMDPPAVGLTGFICFHTCWSIIFIDMLICCPRSVMAVCPRWTHPDGADSSLFGFLRFLFAWSEALRAEEVTAVQLVKDV